METIATKNIQKKTPKKHEKNAVTPRIINYENYTRM